MSQDYGRRLLPNVIDERATTGHARPYASICRTQNPRDGYKDISYATFANAINRCAKYLIDHIRNSTTCDVLAYLGPVDLRYQIISIAALKTGRVMFFTSPRNSIEAHVSLLEESRSTYLVITENEPPIVKTILSKKSLPILKIPSLDTLLDEDRIESILFGKTFDEAHIEPFLLLHTSGSTGIPKIVIVRHGYITSIDAYCRFDEGSEIKNRTGGRRVFNPFPPFHMAGITWSLPIICWVDNTIVLPPPVPLTADIANVVHEVAMVSYSTLPPSIIVEMSENDGYVEIISKLEGLSFAGGPLPKATGDKMSRLTTLHSSYGSTEMMAPPVKPKAREDWQYLHFDRQHSGIEFRKVESTDEAYELVICRKAELELVQAIFATFPEMDEYHSKDLFVPHPSKSDHWLYSGRIDDIVVFSNGEKISPVSLEGTITSKSPDVNGCLFVGTGKFHGALLVEPKSQPASSEARSGFLNKLWPVVQEVNQSTVQTGRIMKDFILFTTPDKPLPRAAKGTIQRPKAIELYQRKIDAFYAAATNSTKVADDDLEIDLSSVTATKTSLVNFLSTNAGIDHLGLDQDIFASGFDSLQALSLARAVNTSLPLGQPRMEARNIYEHPTIRRLAASLHSTGTVLKEDDDDLDTWIEMQQLFHDLQSMLPRGAVAQHTASSVRLDSFFQGSKRRDNHRLLPILGLKKTASNDHDAPSPPVYRTSEHEDFLNAMVPLDGGRTAWLQVLASFLININTFGLVNSFGVYQQFYSSNCLSDHFSSAIAFIGTLEGSLILIIGVVSGPIFDRGHFRITLKSCHSTRLRTDDAQPIDKVLSALTQGFLTGLCGGLMYITSVALIPLHFRRRRGLALGLGLAEAPVGGIIYPVVFRSLLASVGFDWATRVIAFIVLVTLTTAATIIKPSHQLQRPARSLLDLQAFQEVPFSAFFVAAFLIYNAWIVPYFLDPAFALSLGASENSAYYMPAILNAAQLLGRIVPSYLSDIIGGEYLLLLAQIATGILGLSWISVRTIDDWIEIQIFYGFVPGMVANFAAVVMPYLCPSLDVLGTRTGMIYAIAGVGILVGNPIALALSRVEEGRLLGAQLWIGLTALMSTFFFSITAVKAARRREMIEKGKKDRPSFRGDLRYVCRRVLGIETLSSAKWSYYGQRHRVAIR